MWAEGISTEYFCRALEDVVAGKTYYAHVFDEVSKSHLSRADAFYKIITPKELAVLLLTISGLNDKVISEKLRISPSTLVTHRRNIQQKTDTQNDRELIAYALEWGLTSQKAKWVVKN
jgi:DNA-binding NarL/FixJ family response regulator